MNLHLSNHEIIALLQPGRTLGQTDVQIRSIASLKEARPGDLSFLGNVKYKAEVTETQASMVLVPLDFDEEPKAGQQFLFVANPSASLATLCASIEAQLWPKPVPGVHPTAYVHPDATVSAEASVGPMCVVEEGAVVGKGSHLMAQVFVGRSAKVGSDCVLMPGVKLTAECELQDRVRLHAGVVVGADGYGYEFSQGRHVKVPQVGRVVIESDVEIGANTTIDRARFSETRIGEGTKIDNLVQIAHNVIIGRHCLLCAQVGVSGSTKIGDYVILGGQVGVAGHINLANGTKVGAQSGIGADTTPGEYLNGSPALPYMLERRITVLRKRIPDLFRKVDSLFEELEKLKKASSL